MRFERLKENEHLHAYLDGDRGPLRVPVRQVYGFIFGLDGRILVQQNERHHNLPGGKPEEGENLRDTLAGEALEKSQVLNATLADADIGTLPRDIFGI